MENGYIFPKYQDNAHDITWFLIYCQKPSKNNCERVNLLKFRYIIFILTGIFLQLSQNFPKRNFSQFHKARNVSDLFHKFCWPGKSKFDSFLNLLNLLHSSVFWSYWPFLMNSWSCKVLDDQIVSRRKWGHTRKST